MRERCSCSCVCVCVWACVHRCIPSNHYLFWKNPLFQFHNLRIRSFLSYTGLKQMKWMRLRSTSTLKWRIKFKFSISLMHLRCILHGKQLLRMDYFRCASVPWFALTLGFDAFILCIFTFCTIIRNNTRNQLQQLQLRPLPHMIVPNASMNQRKNPRYAMVVVLT